MIDSPVSRGPAAIVVGVGASAGGVEALSSFLDNVTPPPRTAFLVVMHLSSQRPSHLPDILARHTGMVVRGAEDGLMLEANTVYVMLPGQMMMVSSGRLQILPVSPAERVPTVIDRLFNSLATEYAERAIGVVLSGTGADGALGLKAIKERGGLTIAQGREGSTPLFSGMPKSAVAAGAIDEEVPVEEIGKRIAETIADMDADRAGSAERAQQRIDLQRQVCALLLDQVGHDFSGYKPSTFYRRVQRRMHALEVQTGQAYLERLQQSTDEVKLLFRDLLISVTSFFRDGPSFGVLEGKVTPLLFKDKRRHEEVRVWVPGCATGEEAYSLGIILLEYIDRVGGGGPNVRIFATDIDENALTIARKGRYPSVLLDDVSAERRRNFFIEDHGHFTVDKRLREICTFSPQNVLRDPPFSRIDLVSCRNLLIYLGPEFQDRILPILHYALRPDGFLFVGIAEGATRHDALFAPVSKEHRIYQRLPHSTTGTALPLLQRNSTPVSLQRSFDTRLGSPSNTALRRQIEARMLQAHVPPHVLVNARGDALFYSGRTGNYLEFPVGAPTRHLLTNARKELRLGLRRALHEAIDTQLKVQMPEIALQCDDGLRRVQASIEPFEDGDTPLYLVVFNDHGMAPPIHADADAEAAGGHSSEQLARELRETRDQLQSTYEEFETAIEELRVANEELMSLNEELQSSNEELETSKEELQSVNEELQTVNNEMVHHAEALDQANADLRGLLESTQIATILLDRDLAIRSYTRSVSEIFTVLPSDRGRLITDLAHQLVNVDLQACLDQTVSQRRSVEMAVSRKDNAKHYLMCMLPYTGAAQENAGVVLTFVDITALIEADARHKTMIGELNHRVRNMLAVVSAMANQTLMNAVEGDALEAFLDRLHAMARTYKLLTETGWSTMSFRQMVSEELGVIARPERFSLHGPSLALDPREALALGMVVHELATNALKYGALSSDDGHVDVRWGYTDEQETEVEIRWTESGGPAISHPQPARRGFGTLLVERQLAYELKGHSSITYAPEGLQVTMHLPRLPSGHAPDE